jgi:hypothetical protein
MSEALLEVGVAKHLNPSYVTFFFDDPVDITDGSESHPRWTPTESRNLDSLMPEGKAVFDALAGRSAAGADIVEVWTAGRNFVRVTVGNPLHRDQVIATVAADFFSRALGEDVQLVALEGYIS